MEHNFYTNKNTLQEINKIVNDHEITLTEDDVFDLLKIKYRWPYQYSWNQHSVEVLCEYGVTNVRFYDRDGRFIFDEWKKYYDSGFTTILSNVFDLTPELRKLYDKIFALIGEQSNANLYFTKGSTNHRISFPHHNHEYNVIVKPIYGESRWILGEKMFIPKQSFIVPALTRHSVCESKEKKLSLTINFNIDVFDDGT